MVNYIQKAMSMKGYDQLDLLYQNSFSKSVRFSNGEGYRISSGTDSGIGIRAVVLGKAGYAYVTQEKDIEEGVKRAIKLSKYSSNKIELGKFKKYPTVKKVYDKKLPFVSTEDLVEELKVSQNLVKQNKCELMECNIGISEESVRYINSEGSDASFKGTETGFAVETRYKDESGTWDTGDCYRIKNIPEITEKACEIAKIMSKKISIKTGPIPVVFHPFSIGDLFLFSIVPWLNADNVQRNKSVLAGKLGEKVFSDKLTICDDNLLRGGLGSCPFDSEGTPGRRKILIKNGIVNEFMYDLARANIENKKSTANGFRSYDGLISIAPSNFVVSPGKKDILKDIDFGLLLHVPLNPHATNVLSGDFSVGVAQGAIIKNGELIGSPKHSLLSGNFFDVFSKIKAVGNDTMKTSDGFNGFNYVTPSILSECLVIGE